MLKTTKKVLIILIVLIVILISFLSGFLFKIYFKIIGKTNFKSNNPSVPVLMYHSISNNQKKLFVVKTNDFKKQMKYIKDNGYKTLTVDELYKYMVSKKTLPKKSVVITFDDGYKDNYKNAYPILKKYNLKATIFAVTDFLQDSSTIYLNKKEINEMQKNNIEIECHTLTHNKLSKLSYIDQLKILKTSKQNLEKDINKNVYYIAYPFGAYNKDTLKAVKQSGYKMAFTTHMGYCNKQSKIFKIPRICVPGIINLNTFKYIFH